MSRNFFVIIDRKGTYTRRQTLRTRRDADGAAAILSAAVTDGEVRVIASDKEWVDMSDADIRAAIMVGTKRVRRDHQNEASHDHG